MEKRIERLKESLLNDYDRAVFLERVYLLEEAHQKYAHMSPGKKYALGFAHVIRNMTVLIEPDELIVGGVREIIPDEEEERYFMDLAEQNDYSSLELFSFDPLGLIEIKDIPPRYAPSWFNSWGHMTVSWPVLLEKGFSGIAEDAKQRLSELENNDVEKKEEKKEFLENALIACDAMILLGRRYAEKAREMAVSEQNRQRKTELIKIADICDRVPAHPSSTYWEALQAMWFTNMVLHCVCGARDWGFGRFDVYLYPYFKNHVESVDEPSAIELLECFFIKINQIIGIGVENYTPKRSLSVNSLQYLIIGGQDQNGTDMTNELSHLVLDAVTDLELKQPTIEIRYHEGLDRKLFHKACDIVKKGMGNPAFFNDRTVIQALENAGIDHGDAAEYVHYGCVNPNLPGKEDGLREAWHNLPKYLELAMNQGRCLLTGRKIGVTGKTAGEMHTFEDLLEAWRLEVRNGVRAAVDKVCQSDKMWRRIKPFAFESLLLENCIKNAECCTGGGVAYKHMNNHGVGIATLANSLAAIKQLVFDDGRLSLREFREILRVNFKGHGELREEIFNKLPKFGNDIDYVDDIAKSAGRIFCDEVRCASPIPDTGRILWPTFYSLWHHREMGKHTAARADGTPAMEPISESQSPVYGTDIKGPTAVFNSLAKLPFEYTPGGAYNFTLQPSLFEGNKGTLILASLLDGYFSQGGIETQINVLDKNILLDARNNPHKHRNLLVRVVGYSAYFVTLSPDQQSEIISRTEFGFTH